jgi:hypothetical protein
MRVKEALSKLQDWQLVDHRDQSQSYPLGQLERNLQLLKAECGFTHTIEKLAAVSDIGQKVLRIAKQQDQQREDRTQSRKNGVRL